MTRLFVAVVTALATLHFSPAGLAAIDNTWDYSVQVSARVEESPARITLSWVQDSTGVPSSYAVSRKAPGAQEWGNPTILSGDTTSFTDTDITAGVAYEYRVAKTTPKYRGYGYVVSGIRAPLVEQRGKIILLVDDSFSTSLARELSRLEQDLTGDGWTVLRRDVPRTASVSEVKAVIVGEYRRDPANVKSVFLFGHLAVPYSGQLNPDGHPDHIGAWPADAFYGDMDGVWTDMKVNYTQTLNQNVADAARLSNTPGDGKFDQSILPSAIELQVGRVDLAKMPGRVEWGGPATFPSETELLRNYLNKNHDFRHRRTNPPRRAILGDYFGLRGGEAFAASGFRSFAPLVGADNIRNLNREFDNKQGVWISEVSKQDYLLAYGCGPGGYSTIGGLGGTGIYNDGTTTEMVSHDVRGVFNLIFGSWLGDWDQQDNFLRSPLATSQGLVSVWSGRPHWFIHAMGLGETIGHSARVAQNNTGLYETEINSAQNRIHIALMGDPTLRLHPVVPATNLQALPGNAAMALTWTASTDTQLIGYHVYRASSPKAGFTRLTAAPIRGTNYRDLNPIPGASYMVRAIKLETTPSGTYENAAQGVFWSAGDAAAAEPVIASAITNAATATGRASSPGPATTTTDAPAAASPSTSP